MKMNKANILAVFALALALGASGAMAAKKGERGQLSAKDYKFALNAAQGGMAEVQLGELARQRAVNPQVKSFADKMVKEHGKANDDLKQIVTKKGAILPADLPSKETSTMKSLEKATGADFDREYVEHMVKDHRKDVKEFEEAAKSLSDPDL